MTASLEQTVSREDVNRFGEVTGDINPLHFDAEFAATTVFGVDTLRQSDPPLG